MIDIQGLCKTYKRNQVFADISFSVPQNHIFAIAGANGAGKTTLLKLLALLIKPDAGRILVNGRQIHSAPEKWRDRIGYVPQVNAFFYELSVKDNLEYWGGAGGIDPIPLLGLGDSLHKKVSSLSGGIQRRLNLALGLLHDPDILIMDEPLTGVDSGTRRQILAWMGALKQRGMTILYSTHHTDEIAGTADDLLLLKSGAVTYHASIQGQAEGKIASLFTMYI